MADIKKKSNLLTGEDLESAINMKYCEALKKAGGPEIYKNETRRMIEEERKRKAKKNGDK